MPESLIAHFAAPPSDVERWLDCKLGPSVNDTWCVLGASSYLLLAYPNGDYESEYEPDEIARVRNLLGAFPSFMVQLELRRSAGRAAHDAAVALGADLLRAFPGVIQDTSGYEYWTLADLEAGAAARAAAELWPEDGTTAELGDA